MFAGGGDGKIFLSGERLGGWFREHDVEIVTGMSKRVEPYLMS
jgi:hypothetical protein